MKKSALAFLLCLALLVPMFGATALSEETDAFPMLSKSGIPISAPGVHPITKEKTTISVFIQQLGYKLTDVTTNSFTKELEEKTNVHLDMTVVPSDSYQEKLNLILASGDYPDVIMSGGVDNFGLVRYGTGEGILIPLNDLIDTQGYYIKERLAYSSQFLPQMTAPDGNIYGIPGSEGGVPDHGSISYKLWMNTQWLKNLGLEMLTTTDEFRAVLEAFRDKDPNGNGLKDEIPLTGAIKTWSADPYLNLINAFGYYTEDLYELKDDKFRSVANTEYFRDAMDYLAGLYADGLLDPGALTQNEQQLSALGNNPGDAIVGAATCGHLGMLLSINDVERAKQYECVMPLQGPNGYRGIPAGKTPSVSGAMFMITDKCKDPEIAFKVADYLCSEEAAVRLNMGIKGVHWDDADPGTFGMDGKTPAKYKYLNFAVSGEGAVENDVWEHTAKLLEPDTRGAFQVVGDLRDPANYEAFLYQETMKMMGYAADVQDVPPMFMDEDMSSQIAQIKTPLQDYVKSSIVEFITGKKTTANDWDAYVSGLEGLGYSRYIDLMQTAYDAQAK